MITYPPADYPPGRRSCIVFMRIYFFAYLFSFLASCGHAKNNADKNKIAATSSKEITQQHERTRNSVVTLPTFDKAHPAAKNLMNEAFYFSTADETAPFGNNEGVDIYAGFMEWRPIHKNENSTDFLFEKIKQLGYPAFDIHETDILKIKPYIQEWEFGNRFLWNIDATIVSLAFSQLYLEGTIEKDLKEITAISVKRQLLPELLILWGDPYKEERKMKLKKMLAILTK